MRQRSGALLLALGLIAFAPALAAAEEQKAAEVPAKAEDPARLLPADSVTKHVIEIGGRRIAYTTTAGTLPVLGPKGEVAAKIFYVAHRADQGEGRPITFVFNGGPGAGSAFLQLGAMGPRVVNFTPNGAAPAQPVQLADNPDSWLDFTDLVFIDPVSTGFSRTTTGGADAQKAFWGVERDADALASVVRLYLTRNSLELAPIFLVGESYGGFRAPLIADRLLQAGIQVRGAVLISPALEFSMIRGDTYMVAPLAAELPTIAATHLEQTMDADGARSAIAEAEAFAWSDYLTFLASGRAPDEALLAKLSHFSGLSPEIISRNNGRVTTSLYRREYRRAHDRALSMYDGSVSIAIPRGPEDVHVDPILDAAVTVLKPAMELYARSELNFQTDLPYYLLNREVSGNWDFGTKPNRQGFAGALDELQQARTRNPGLSVLVAAGYTDFVIPYSGSQLLVRQLSPIEGAKPVSVKVYAGGHMMYLRPTSRRDLKRDAAELYASAQAAR